MFKVNNKDTRTYFTPFSSVSIVNFEQVNAGSILNTDTFHAVTESYKYLGDIISPSLNLGLAN